MDIIRWVLMLAALLVLGIFAIFAFLEAEDKR
jgi:hypothetical protein